MRLTLLFIVLHFCSACFLFGCSTSEKMVCHPDSIASYNKVEKIRQCLPRSQKTEIELFVGLPYGNHNIGHSYIKVPTFDENEYVIYDFGRYGKAWGYLRFSGEGIMRVWRGTKAVEFFINKQRGFRTSIGYTIEVTLEQAEKIYDYYEDMIKEGVVYKRYPNHIRYKLKQDFDGVEIQCTAMALDGLRRALPKEVYQALLPVEYNRGTGFTEPQKEFYCKVQKERGINRVSVPLDVIEALDNAMKKKKSIIKRRKVYRIKGESHD